MRRPALQKPNKASLILTVVAAVMVVLLSAAAAFALIWPQQSDVKQLKKGKLIVDAGNAKDGYIMCAAKKNKKRLKLRVAYGKELVTYDLNGEGRFEVIPLQYGSGSYTVTLYENTTGSRYSEQGKVKFKAQLDDEMGAFLVPNKWVDYSETSEAYLKSIELCEGLADDRAKFDAITQFINKNFVFDFIKVVTAKSGTMPDIDGCLKSKKGICQDLAALAVCLFRVQQIPAKLMIGYADQSYHAWVLAYVNGEELFYDPTAALNAMPKVKNYTAEHMF